MAARQKTHSWVSHTVWNCERFYTLCSAAHAPTSDYDDNKIEEFYDQPQNVIEQTPKKDILAVKGDWNVNVGRDACGNWQGICGPFCGDDKK